MLTIDVHHHILPDVSVCRTPCSTSWSIRRAPSRTFTNTFARTPNIKYIFSHAGGTIPYLASRFAVVDEMGVIEGGSRRGTAADTFRRLYWDTALSWRDPVLQLLRSVVGIDRVLFGTDYPYLRRDLAIGSREQLGRTVALSDAERAAVLGETALKLFPRVASRHAPAKVLARAVS
jgi:predicted TIM-barrel fold metal-dependent hydrolase